LVQTPTEGLVYYPAALASYDRAIERQPLRSQFWFERGMLKLEGVGRRITPIDNAHNGLADVEEAVRRYPNSPSRQADVACASAAGLQATITGSEVTRALDEWRLVKSPTTPKEVGTRLGREAAERIAPNSIERVQKAAERTLKLDEATPHFDKKLL